MNEKTYHVSIVTGTNGQTGHLAQRARISDKPISATGDLSFGWMVSDSDEMTEEQLRAWFKFFDVEYPDRIPVICGDYSISEPNWNIAYWRWHKDPNKSYPVWMQPLWFLILNWERFGQDPYGIDDDLGAWAANHPNAELVNL